MLGGCDCWLQASADGRGPGQWGSQRGFLENEHAIWMGDLNYRLTIPDEQVLPIMLVPVCCYGKTLGVDCDTSYFLPLAQYCLPPLRLWAVIQFDGDSLKLALIREAADVICHCALCRCNKATSPQTALLNSSSHPSLLLLPSSVRFCVCMLSHFT